MIPDELNIKPGIYRHFKGFEVEVLFVAEHAESLEPMVVYHHLAEKRYWVRPAKAWNDIVEHDGKKVPRFVRIERSGYVRCE